MKQIQNKNKCNEEDQKNIETQMIDYEGEQKQITEFLSYVKEKQPYLFPLSEKIDSVDTIHISYREQPDGQTCFYYAIPLFNRITFKMNDFQQQVLNSFNHKNIEKNIYFFSDYKNNLLKSRISILQKLFDETSNNLQQIENLKQQINHVQQQQLILEHIILRNETLENYEKANTQFAHQIQELRKCNLMQELHNSKSYNLKQHYFVKEIQVISQQKNLLTFQYLIDNHLYQSNFTEVLSNENLSNLVKKFERLSQNDYDEKGGKTSKFFISYGIDINSNFIYRFSDVSWNLERFLSEGRITLDILLEVILTVAKGLQLMHQQQISHGNLSVQQIYLNKHGQQVKIDLLYNIPEQQKLQKTCKPFEKDIEDLGNLIEYLLIKNIVFMPVEEGIFVNFFEEDIKELIQQCKESKEQRKQLSLDGLVMWFEKFGQVSKTYAKISQIKIEKE